MAFVRVILLLLLSAALLLADTFKLFLKDGDYHLVREYQVQGDRIRYYSTERGDWEEIPTALVDLAKTEQVRAGNKAKAVKEERELAEEEEADRALRREIASIPMESGAYYRTDEKVTALDAAQYQVITDKKRAALKLLSPIPLIPGKATVVIQGDHSKFVVHDERPNFYFRPEKQERFGIIRVTPKKNQRIVENVSIIPVSNEAAQDRKQVEVFQQQMQGNLYKVWPEKPLEPGEYAVVEFDDRSDNPKDDLELLVWDFAFQPK
jgi:hypothetical protein